MDIIESLKWRYATKRMSGKKIPQQKLDNILEAIRLSGSSMGLQPYSIIVVGNDELKKQIQPIANNQPQIVESSHLLVFASWLDLSTTQIEEYMDLIANTRNQSKESLGGFSNALKGFAGTKTKEEIFQWSSRQAYIALGTGLVAAAAENIDATPMEGFKPAELDAFLGLNEKGLKSVALLALGFRDEEKDALAHAKKVRRDKDKLFINLN